LDSRQGVIVHDQAALESRSARDGGGHSIAVARDQPATVVAVLEGQQGQAELLDGIAVIDRPERSGYAWSRARSASVAHSACRLGDVAQLAKGHVRFIHRSA
jgi:hypothetical protein